MPTKTSGPRSWSRAKGAGAGRVKGSPQLVIRLSEAEYDEFRRRAYAAKLTRSAYARNAVLAGWVPPPMPEDKPLKT